MASFDRAMTLRADLPTRISTRRCSCSSLASSALAVPDRLFRQDETRNWDQIIAAVAAALQATRVTHSSVNNFQNEMQLAVDVGRASCCRLAA
jgi:hypothetical protein